MGLIGAVLCQRCPRCRKGPVFHGIMSTYESCRVCGLKYEREPGYFYGAMYASYVIGLVTTAYWLPLLLMGFSPVWVLVPPVIQLIVQIPLSYRYSRVIWLHMDHRFDPLPERANAS